MKINESKESEILREIHAILMQYLPDAGVEVSGDTDIFSLGMDSVSTLLFLTEIENKYSIALATEDIPYHQLGTISGISSYVMTALEPQASCVPKS